MAYKVIILYRLYMPSYFLGTFTEYPFLDRILIDLKVRGVQNILITCTDNLNVFTDTIRTIF